MSRHSRETQQSQRATPLPKWETGINSTTKIEVELFLRTFEGCSCGEFVNNVVIIILGERRTKVEWPHFPKSPFVLLCRSKSHSVVKVSQLAKRLIASS